MLGRVVGKYRIVEKIGEGGMGTVFSAEHTVLGSPAGIKFWLPRTPSAAYALAALERVPLLPLAAHVVLLQPGGARAPTYGPPGVHSDGNPFTQYLVPEPPPHDGLPRWVPILVLLVALAIAAAAVILIGGGDVAVAK